MNTSPGSPSKEELIQVPDYNNQSLITIDLTKALVNNNHKMTIAVVGIGLIGGSLMIDLRKRGFADKIIGVDSNIHHRNIALLCGLVDETDTLENAVDRSDLIILTTPVNTNCICCQEFSTGLLELQK